MSEHLKTLLTLPEIASNLKLNCRQWKTTTNALFNYKLTKSFLVLASRNPMSTVLTTYPQTTQTGHWYFHGQLRVENQKDQKLASISTNGSKKPSVLSYNIQGTWWNKTILRYWEYFWQVKNKIGRVGREGSSKQWRFCGYVKGQDVCWES